MQSLRKKLSDFEARREEEVQRLVQEAKESMRNEVRPVPAIEQRRIAGVMWCSISKNGSISSLLLYRRRDERKSDVSPFRRSRR